MARNSPHFLRRHDCMRGLAGWATLIMVVVGNRPAAAQQDLFDASLRTGEFATAMRIANSQSDDRDRAAQLRQIASIQAALGERGPMIHTLAQQPGAPARGLTSGQGLPNGLPGGNGGGTLADFDSLIELITSTIEPDTWSDVGGPGAIDEFAGGVYIDAERLMRRAARPKVSDPRSEDPEPPEAADGERFDPESQGLHVISLPCWERAVFRELAQGRPIPAHLRSLGIAHISHVLAYPNQRDLVIAGPAVSPESAGIRLSDLVVVWHAIRCGVPEFGCSIDPLPQNLARAQQFLAATSGRSIQPAERRRWLDGLRDAVGQQEVRVFGLDADTDTARTLVEADYHMKLVGIGLEPAPPGIVNYLRSVKLNADGSLPPLELLRWWFTLTDQPMQSSDDRLAFLIPKQTVRVQSENELVDRAGVRQGTGTSSPANSAFAASFTEQFLQLTETYPIYARLRSLFDLSFAMATIEANDLTSQVDWQPTLLADAAGPLVSTTRNAQRVETVINHRVLAKKHIVAAVSGGVVIRPDVSELRIVPAANRAELNRTYQQATPHDDDRFEWVRNLE